MARTTEPDVDIHPGAGYTCDQCNGKIVFVAMTTEEYCAFADHGAELSAALALAEKAEHDRDKVQRETLEEVACFIDAINDDEVGSSEIIHLDSLADEIRALADKEEER